MEEISLRELIETLLKQKKLIIGITMIAVLTTGLFSFFMLEPVYETRMVLMASNFTERLQPNQLSGNGVEGMLESLSQYPAMTLDTYRQQVTAPRVMRATIEELGLEEDYDVERLARAISLETLQNTNLITIKMQHGDPEKAALIVNTVGEKFVEFVSEKAQEHASQSSQYVVSQMEVEEAQLDDALVELREFLSQPRGVSELQMELDARLSQATSFKTQLTDLEIREPALQSAIQVAQAEGNTNSQIMINDNAGSQQITLESTETLLKIELAEVQSNIQSFRTQITEIQDEIEELQVELQDKKHQERLINQRVNIAENNYDAFVKKYEELRVAESSQIGDASITVISRAFPTTTPIGPRKTLNVAIAGVLGVMIGVFAAFFIEYWKTSGKEQEALEIK
ncbi:lipopolysaccharide biosynthesis protein [Alkaliphilus metalliredigens QYMF]|uniref:Lipopolysaccharide biosynthesis protein n=1 Tax=Alkaliphilus metalliredigens (strain QYMF) TaxID=293826 RepID=A6TJR1_ALKMQ|nr:Wzz/FepE/Etk N-terminal domain-containing protein [Alkaliphilus metalliredigens]ABR46429.1 lipopolysaccharide biosynthesis protein [Alkaliphilus metalliredigens QYMF]